MFIEHHIKHLIFEGPYGKAPDKYSEIGFALRECSDTGWVSTSSSDCAMKLYIKDEDAKEYFKDTELADRNAEEYTETIKQVI